MFIEKNSSPFWWQHRFFFRAKRNTYYYSSVNLTNAETWSIYLKRYQCLGVSYRLSLIWSLSLVRAKAHLTESGLDLVRKLKAYLSALKQSDFVKANLEFKI